MAHCFILDLRSREANHFPPNDRFPNTRDNFSLGDLTLRFQMSNDSTQRALAADNRWHDWSPGISAFPCHAPYSSLGIVDPDDRTRPGRFQLVPEEQLPTTSRGD